ncbi:hypothetical protein [Sporosarcina sp. FA9]|uniref:hypothetical protein n=1 Tax=Sporosarcina sp. FA9 TaxID=3413030 RepID=UPI003F6571D8
MSIYKKHGAVGLIKNNANDVYSVRFKLDVLSFIKRTGAPYLQTALQFEFTNPPLIASSNKKFLEATSLFQSMSRKGNCFDNSPMDSFFGILKQEKYYGLPFRTY